jgi:hypothetical protein
MIKGTRDDPSSAIIYFDAASDSALQELERAPNSSDA